MADEPHLPPRFYQQSGVIAHRTVGGQLQVALITSRKRKRWVIPKGVIEPDLSAAQSAAQEAFEEAGLRGRLSTSSIGAFRYHKWGGELNVEVFLMEVTEVLAEWPEADFRDRKWLPPEQAAEHVQEPQLQQLIRALSEHLKGDN